MKKHRKIKKNIRFIFTLLLLIFLILTVISYRGNYIAEKLFGIFITNKKEYNPEKPPELLEKKLSIIMVGDSLIHGAVWQDAEIGKNQYNFYKIIEPIKPIIKKHDLAFYNQESILGGTSLGLSTYPRFNSPQEAGDAFVDAGFNLVSLANNHTLDRGEKAIISSSKYWSTKKGVITAGSYTSWDERGKVIIGEKNGIKYALLSYTTLTNGLKTPTGKGYLVDIYSNELAKKDIEKYRDKVDLLMVSMHWGVEYSHNPSKQQKEIATFLANNEVDIVIGHHPHVVQPVEFINDTMVIYSLGNIVSAQRGISRLTGLMMSVTVVKKNNEKIKLVNPKAELTYNCPTSSGSKRNYKVIPYGKLNNSLLPNYESYYNTYMKIVTSKSDKIEKIFRR